MFYTTQDIWDSLYEIHNSNDDTTEEAKVRRETRKAYYELCRGISWAPLRDEVTYDFDEDTDGMWLPANLAGIDCVGNDEYEWKKATPNGALKEDIQTRMWYIAEYNSAVLTSGADITMASGATTFTGGANITEAMIGEYIRFDSQSGSHKLTSTTTIATAYYGDALTGAGAYEVRPVGTQKIKLVAPQYETDTTDATIYYWKMPAQLYDGSQLMVLPTSAVLELATSVKLYGINRDNEMQDNVKKDLYGSKGRYEGELPRTQAMNPEFIMPVHPESFGGAKAGYGASNKNTQRIRQY